MSSYLGMATGGITSATGTAQALGGLTGAVGQDWYTAHNVFNPDSNQYAMVQGAGGNVFGATVSQSNLQPSIFSGIFGTTGFGGLSPLIMLIIIAIVIVIGYAIVKRV